MSASLVGSEMCIRDRDIAMRSLPRFLPPLLASTAWSHGPTSSALRARSRAVRDHHLAHPSG
eukprot:9596362-Alexandrium_andersonii.AAC.1